jgi:fumarate hydratase subunit beta
MMGKGERSPQVAEAIKQHGAVYLITIGGAGALLSLRVKSAEVVAYPDLGAEAVLKLEVEHFPAVVAIDAQGSDQFKIGQARYRVK